jgi:hypothetical protein
MVTRGTTAAREKGYGLPQFDRREEVHILLVTVSLTVPG